MDLGLDIVALFSYFLFRFTELEAQLHVHYLKALRPNTVHKHTIQNVAIQNMKEG